MESAMLGAALGWFIDRFGPQGLVRVGIVVFGCGLMLLSQTDTLPAFYAAFVVIALGASFCGMFPVNTALIHWFERWRARALSSMSIGLALGGISVPLVAWSLQTFGWRATAFSSGVIAIVVGLPLAMVIRRRPEDYGDTVDGVPPTAYAATGEAAPPDPRPAFPPAAAGRKPAFWLLPL